MYMNCYENNSRRFISGFTEVVSDAASYWKLSTETSAVRA